MFNLKDKEEKKYKGTKIYLAKIRDIEVERLLAIMFSMFEGYIKQEGKMPEKIIINKESYNKILEYNKKIILEEDDKKYILCTELEVEEVARRR